MGKINTIEGLQEAVKKRANQRVQDRITAFKKGMEKLLGALLHGTDSYWYHHAYNSAFTNDESVEIFRRFAEGEFKKGWPVRLWSEEEGVVAAEIMRVTDEVQKALLAPEPSADDCQPAVEVKEG